MAKPKESLTEAVKKSEVGSPDTIGATPTADSETSFLQLFLARLKLFAVLKQDNPGLKLDVAKVNQLDADLDSPNAKVRLEALTQVDIISQLSRVAADKAEKTTLEAVVDGAQIETAKKVILKTKAAWVEAVLASTSPKTQAELEKIFGELHEIREGMGEKNLGVGVETAVGFELIDNKIKELQVRKNIRDFKQDKEFRVDPLEKYEGKFDATIKTDDPIQVRVAWNPGLKTKVDEFRRHVREELLVADKEQKLKDLGENDVFERIKRIGELKARMHELNGDKFVRGVSAERMDEIRDTLNAVQDEYQGEMARKIAERLKSQNNGVDVLKHVPVALNKIIENHRQVGRSTYDFGATDTFDNVSQEVLGEAQKMKSEAPKMASESTARRGGMRMEDMDDISAEELEEYRNGYDLYEKHRERELEAKKFQQALSATDYKLDSPDFMRDIMEEDGVDRVLADMLAHGLSSDPETLRVVRSALGEYRSAMIEPRAKGMTIELSQLLSQKKYAEAINLTMEYLARVGLREASSDWKLAVILRQQKDIISRINPDAAEAFEQRQHLLFLPNPNGLSHEKFGEVMAQVLTKGNLDYALSPANVFMLGTRIELGEELGSKMLNINTSMYKDLLRSEEASMRLLSADVNSTDSTLRGILVEHMFGKGAKLTDNGLKLWIPGRAEPIDIQKAKVKMRFFDIDAVNGKDHYGKLMDEAKVVTLYEMFERTHWMLRDAQQFWWYGRDWEKHMVNYPKNKMRNAPKKIASMGRMLGAYNGEFEKYDRSMVDISLLGTLLQPNEVYKIDTTVGANVKDILVEKYKQEGLWGQTQGGVTFNADRAEAIGNLMVKLIVDKVRIDEEEFVVDTLAQEAAQLIGNTIDTTKVENFYDLIRQRYLNMGMEAADIPSLTEMSTYYSTWKSADIKGRIAISDEKTKFWGAQAEEMAAWIDMRKFEAKDMALINSIRADELQPFLEREEAVFGTRRSANNLREFFQEFQYVSIMDPKKLSQGDDSFQYGTNYYPRSLGVAEKYLVKYFNLELNNEEVLEMFGMIQGYVPADVLRKFVKVADRRYLRAQSIQANPFEVAHQGGKWVTNEHGKKEWVKSDSPNTIDYITLKDSNGNKWQAKGRYGERVYVKEMTKRFHSFAYDEKEKWIYRESDVDVRLRALRGKGWITKEKQEDMMAGITGTGQAVDKFLTRLGIDTSKGGGRKARRIMTKIIGIIKKHPLFDDPVWAFWSISNTIWEYMKEVGKELGKEALK